MSVSPTSEKVLLQNDAQCTHSKQKKCRFTYGDSSAITSSNVNIPFLETDDESSDVSQQIPFCSRIYMPPQASTGTNRMPLARSLAYRKLRKYASETSFTLPPNLIKGGSPDREKEMSTPLDKKKIFSLLPVKNDLTVSSRQRLIDDNIHRRSDNSEEEASCSGSDATVPSGPATPIMRHKSLRIFHSNRPRSVYHTNTTSSPDVYNTPTSVTARSVESLQQYTFAHGSSSIDGRRPSNIYNIDDDSLHEFDDEKGYHFIIILYFEFAIIDL